MQSRTIEPSNHRAIHDEYTTQIRFSKEMKTNKRDFALSETHRGHNQPIFFETDPTGGSIIRTKI